MSVGQFTKITNTYRRKRCRDLRKDLVASFSVGLDTRDSVWQKLRAKILSIWNEVSVNTKGVITY